MPRYVLNQFHEYDIKLCRRIMYIRLTDFREIFQWLWIVVISNTLTPIRKILIYYIGNSYFMIFFQFAYYQDHLSKSMLFKFN